MPTNVGRSRASVALAEWVEKSGLTQTQAAVRLDVSTQGRLSHLTNGLRTPKVLEAIAIAKVTGIDPMQWGEPVEETVGAGA